MKLHTANKYLSSLPTEAGKGLRARFDALCKNVFSALELEVPTSAVLAVVGEEYSYTCRAVASAMEHAGHRVAIVALSSDSPAEALVKIGKKSVADDTVAEAVTELRRAASALGVIPTQTEARIVCSLALCGLMGCKNIIFGFDTPQISRAFYELLPLARVVAILPSEAGAADSCAIVRRGVQEVVSVLHGEDEYRAVSAVCASVNCRHNVVSASAISSQILTYKGIEFSFKDHRYALRGHSLGMVTSACAAVLVICALKRRGMNISEADIEATLPSVVSEHGCTIVSYNPCIITLTCREGVRKVQLLNDVERVCALLDKRVYVCSQFGGEISLEEGVALCREHADTALCVEGDASFVQKALAIISECISNTVK